MKKIILASVLTLSLAVGLISGCKSEQEKSAEQKGSVEPKSSVEQQKPADVDQADRSKPYEIREHLSATVTVEKVDLETRHILVKEADGGLLDLYVDESVKRLNEIKPGDKITVEYLISLVSEIREPTAEEKANPMIVAEAAGKTGEEASPAAAGARILRAVVTVVGIDKEAGTVTVMWPTGIQTTVKVAYPERLELLNVNDTVVITYTEAAAISLEPAK